MPELTSLRMAARKFRIPLEKYRAETALGNRYCRYHDDFHREDHFYANNRNALCKRAMREIRRVEKFKEKV